MRWSSLELPCRKEEDLSALQAIARRGKLDFRVIGVAKFGWSRAQLIDHAKASVTENGGFDKDAGAKHRRVGGYHYKYASGHEGDSLSVRCRAGKGVGCLHRGGLRRS